MTKADRTKAFIIEKTAVVFNKKGFAGTSLSDLTEATGLTKGALYGNFKSKDEIALAAYDYNTELVKTAFQSTVNDSKPAIETLLDIPNFFKTNFADIARRGGCAILNSASEADDTQPILKEKVNVSILSLQTCFENTIRRGIQTGEINANADPTKYASIFIALFEGGQMLSKVTGDISYLNNCLEKITDIIYKELKTNYLE